MRMRDSILDVGLRLGDAIDPFHLANGFEAVIGYECQERSNPMGVVVNVVGNDSAFCFCERGSWRTLASYNVLPATRSRHFNMRKTVGLLLCGLAGAQLVVHAALCRVHVLYLCRCVCARSRSV